MSRCYLNDEPHHQCCCNCQSHWEVWTYKAWPKHKKMGYACVVQPGVAVADWPQHLCGCEMYIAKEEKP